VLSIRAGFKGGQTGQLPRASTTRRPPQKHFKNYYLRKHKKYFLKLIIWNKKI